MTRLPSAPTRLPSRAAPGAAVAVAAVLVAGLLALTLPRPVAAQGGGWTLDARGGWILPEGDLADWTDLGEHVGAGLTYRFHPRIGLRFDGAYTHLDQSGTTGPGDPAEGPEINIWHYTLGLELELTEPSTVWFRGNPWEVTLNAGVGGGTYDIHVEDAEPGAFDPSSVPTSDTNPSVTGGLRVGYAAADWLSVYGQSQLYVILGDAGDPEDFLGKEAALATLLGLKLSF